MARTVRVRAGEAALHFNGDGVKLETKGATNKQPTQAQFLAATLLWLLQEQQSDTLQRIITAFEKDLQNGAR